MTRNRQTHCIIVCLLNLMAWKASWAHRTGENEKKDNDKIKKSVQTSSACGRIWRTLHYVILLGPMSGEHVKDHWSSGYKPWVRPFSAPPPPPLIPAPGEELSLWCSWEAKPKHYRHQQSSDTIDSYAVAALGVRLGVPVCGIVAVVSLAPVSLSSVFHRYIT